MSISDWIATGGLIVKVGEFYIKAFPPKVERKKKIYLPKEATMFQTYSEESEIYKDVPIGTVVEIWHGELVKVDKDGNQYIEE